MANQPTNQLVDRIVRILKKDDGLNGLFFKYIGEISIVDIDKDVMESVKYDPSSIMDFFDAYESAIERRTILEIKKRIG
jgi:hypothetical protein